MTDLERVAWVWNEEHARWSVRECGDAWAIYRQDGDAADEIGWVRSMLGADKLMFKLRDAACARAVLTALREPSDAMIQAGQERGNLSHIVGADITDDGWVGVLKDGGARSIFRAMIDAILSDPQP